jgi:hypothetical protein
MQVNGPFDNLARGGFRPAAALARSVQKASASSDLGTHQQDTARNSEKSAPRLQVELVCQDETQRFDPFWDGPRLKPAFVAQLLGQVMPAAHKQATVATAYGATAPRMARLVDRAG